MDDQFVFQTAEVIPLIFPIFATAVAAPPANIVLDRIPD